MIDDQLVGETDRGMFTITQSRGNPQIDHSITTLLQHGSTYKVAEGGGTRRMASGIQKAVPGKQSFQVSPIINGQQLMRVIGAWSHFNAVPPGILEHVVNSIYVNSYLVLRRLHFHTHSFLPSSSQVGATPQSNVQHDS